MKKIFGGSVLGGAIFIANETRKHHQHRNFLCKFNTESIEGPRLDLRKNIENYISEDASSGIFTISGKPGVGKTTLIRSFGNSEDLIELNFRHVRPSRDDIRGIL